MKKIFRPALLPGLLFTFFAGFAKNNDHLTPASGNSPDIKMLSTFLLTAAGNMADGNRVVFAPQYSNSVDGNDAIKISNPGENFGLQRDSRTLAVEARQPIRAGDSIFYNMNHLVPQSYKLLLVPDNIVTRGVNCYLIDKYLNTKTAVSLRDTNRFVLQVTSDPASMAVNRLMVVFSIADGLETPVKFTSISAVNDDNKAVGLNWKVANEIEVDHYEIERSADNINFISIFSSLPAYNTIIGGDYNYTDGRPELSDNFYRIKSSGTTGKISYSNSVKVRLTPAKVLNVYPNPVINHTMQVQLVQTTIADYRIQVTNNIGLVVYSKTIRLNGNNAVQTINLDNNLSKGNYSLSVFAEDGSVITQKLIIQ